jgi:tetratricopeptide (TPR) repeat protein
MHVGNLVTSAGRIFTLALSSLVLIPQALIAHPQDVLQKINTLEQLVQKHLQEQKPQLAIPVLREIISLDAKNVNAQGNLGVLLFFQGSYDEAIPHIRAALQSQPDLWRLQALLGIAEKRTGDPQDAQNDLERAFSNLPASSNPEDQKIRIQAGLELIELQSASAQIDKALSVAARLQELAPQNPQILFVAYQISRQMMDQSLLSMMVAAPDSAEMHVIMAGELGRQGDNAGAIARYREAIRLNPMVPGAHFQLAEQLRTAPDPALNAQAEAEYKAAIQVNRYDELSWRQLGGIMAAKGDFKAAEENYKKALALQPADSDAKTGLAIALISLNQNSEAISLLESAIKDDPTNIVAHYRLSGLYRRAGRMADSQREMEAFHHYQDLKDKLGKVFKQLSGPIKPM